MVLSSSTSVSSFSVRTAMANDINMYAIVQKDQMGLDKAVEEVKHRMSRYSVTVRASPFTPSSGLENGHC